MSARTLATLGVTAALAFAGCGGTSQDANEPLGTFKVSFPTTAFPVLQHLGNKYLMHVAVRNEDSRSIPNVVISLRTLNYQSTQPELADPTRPTWIVDRPPPGGTTSALQTWALGRLDPGRTAAFNWILTPVRSGRFRVDYTAAAGLNGKAKAAFADGSPAIGAFRVFVKSSPPMTTVDPKTGQVVTTLQPTPNPEPVVPGNPPTIPGPNTPTTPGY